MTDEVDRRRPYFKEQFQFTVGELERAEILRRAQIRRAKELHKQREGRYFRLKSYIVDYIHATDIHGVWYLSEQRSLCELIFWITIVCFSLIACIYYIIQTFIVFSSSSVIVTFNTKETPIYKIHFPAVTICPEAKFVHKMISEEEFGSSFASERPPEDQILPLQYWFLLCSYGQNEFKHGSKVIEAGEFFKLLDQIKHSVDSMLIRCELFGSKYNCSDLFFPILTEVGICFTFNMVTREDLFEDEVYNHNNFYRSKSSDGWLENFSGSKAYKMHVYPRRALLSGQDNDLRVIVKSAITDQEILCKSIARGFKVLVHTPTNIPHIGHYYFIVPMNTFTSVALESKFLDTDTTVLDLPVSKRGCYIQNEKRLKYFKIYTRNNCLLECLVNFMLDTCGCVQFYMPRYNETPICGTESIQCARDAEFNLASLEGESRIKSPESSFCNCKPLCTEINYEFETSRTAWYWKNYYENLWGDEVEEDKRKINSETEHISMLSIYFKHNHFLSVMRHEWHGIPDLLSAIGGFFSFFTGMSMVSVVEIFYFISLRIFCNWILHGQWHGI